MLELGIRLSAVAGLVKPGKTLADIGCDHGYLSIALVQNHIAQRMIACDINKGPLAAAEKNIHVCNLDDEIKLRLSDGFEKVEAGECDGAILAGMGGPLGLRILYDGKDRIKGMNQVVLQLQSKISLVRFVLKEWGFVTEEENIVIEDGKFYPMMRLTPPKTKDFYENDIPDFEDFLKEAQERMINLPSDELCNYTYGEKLIENHSPVLYAFLEKEEKRLLSVVENFNPDSDTDPETALARVNGEMDILMLAKWKLQGA